MKRLIFVGVFLCGLTVPLWGYTFAGMSWPQGTTVTYYVIPNSWQLTVADTVAAIQVAADAWNRAGANIHFAYGGLVSPRPPALDLMPTLQFDPSPSVVALTFPWYQKIPPITGPRVMFDADVLFYEGGRRYYTTDCVGTDGVYLQDVAAHEMGHMLGLDHSPVFEATMYPTLDWCDSSRRTLSEDDLLGIRALYPPVPSGTPKPTGKPFMTQE